VERFENCGKQRDPWGYPEVYGLPPALRYRICHKSHGGDAHLGKAAPISADNVVEGSLAFNSKDAANFNERLYAVARSRERDSGIHKVGVSGRPFSP